MDTELYSFALKNTLSEILNVCPDINSAFMFGKNGELIVGDEKTPEKIVTRVADVFDGILDKSDVVGGFKCAVINGSKGKVNVSSMGEFYLVTVTPEKADMNYVNTLTNILIPTVLKLLEKIHPAPTKSVSPPPDIKLETPKLEKLEEVAEEIDQKTLEEKKKEAVEHPVLLPEPPVSQLIIENLGGLLVPSDTVRIDGAVLGQWSELYNDKEISEVEIETFDGKSTRCKVKPIKDAKYEGKGIIQMPEKIQLTLEVKKGELVRVKPVIT
jgi:predicted regulator of Ras-like GTPase activity (Roadblock/LC7/MglB family)